MKNNKLIVFVGIGLEAVGLIMAGVWFGQFIDSYFKLKYVFISIMPLIALAGWLAHIVFMIKNMNNKDS